MFFSENASVYTIKEVVQSQGTPGASSFYNSHFRAELAFNNPSYARGWKSGDRYGDNPAMVWYKFREGFEPAEVTFRSSGKRITETKVCFKKVCNSIGFHVRTRSA